MIPQRRGMTARALTAGVRDLGAAVGLVGLSAHDLRHFWATRASAAGRRWTGCRMPAGGRRRRGGGECAPAVCGKRAKIANQGVLLGERG